MTENPKTWRDCIDGPWEEWGQDMLGDLADYMQQQDPEGFQKSIEALKQIQEEAETSYDDQT